MSWWVARPRDDGSFEERRPEVELGPLLGAAAIALVSLGILALLAAVGLEQFGGSVSVLVGLLCGAVLVVLGLAGVASRRPALLPHITTAGRRALEPLSVDGSHRADDRSARQRADETRIMRTVAAGPPPPPRRAPRRAPHRQEDPSSLYGRHAEPPSRRSSSRTSA